MKKPIFVVPLTFMLFTILTPFLFADTLTPESANTYYDFGASCFSKQQYSEGIDMWVKATQLDKEGGMQGEIENAINTYIKNASPVKVVIDKVDSSRPWIILPLLEISQKKMFEGLLLEYKTKLQASSASDFIYFRNLASIEYGYKGDLDKGLENAKTALRLLADHKDLAESEMQKRAVYIHRLLGDIYLHKMEIELAEQNYQEALKINVSDLDSICGLAVVNTIKGDFGKAKELYGKLLNLNPNNWFVQEALRRLENK